MAFRNLIGEVLDGKYRIEKQLGEGGMGAVYLAMHLGTERPVALKVIAPQFMKHDEFVERFRREARAAGRLRHPNVVDVTDFGFARVGADQVAYLVMEYLDGCTLDEILTEESSLPLSWVIDILEQTCSAVDEAHQQGIIHRDLKPDNIWLEPNRRGGYTIKVLDFGIAKLDEPASSSAAKDENAPLRLPHYDSLAPTQQSESATLIPSASNTTPPSELSEASTQMQPAPHVTAQADDISEAGTRVFAPEEDSSEAGTRMMSADSLEEAGTRMFSEHHTTDKQLAMHTSSVGSLTRVGSILGTPLYMSPEQCRGESLDARADIYSLGVIAYRLLSGQTPFSGDLPTVMRMHREEQPPPLLDKRVPKKVRALVMASLAKNPEQRPPTAAAFASALRAHSEGAGSLIRRALTLYAEHIAVFLRLTLMVYAPVVFTTLLQVALNYLRIKGITPSPWGSIAYALAFLLNLLTMFVAGCVVAGVNTWLVTQMLAVPLRPLELRPAFLALKKRLRPFLKTAMAISYAMMCGIMMCVLPGLFIGVLYALVTPVLMMEDLKGHGAFLRSRELVMRSLRTVIAIVLLHSSIPFFMSIVTTLLITAVVKVINPGGGKEIDEIVGMIQQLVQLPFIILLSSLASVVVALLYWKTRLAGGETLRHAFMQFAEEETTASRWQQRMRTRFHTPTRTHR